MPPVKNKKSSSSNEAFPLDYGKVPPQAIELEEAVLGAIMLEKDAVITVLDILSPESFYKEDHQKIFRAIVSLFRENSPVDTLTVIEQLKKNGELEEVGGFGYITQMTSKVASSAHVEFHSHIIQQKYIQRELIKAGNEIISKAYDENTDVEDLINDAENRIFEISSGNIKRETQAIPDLLKEAIKKIQEVEKRETHLVGVPSGFTKLDRVTCGWQNSDLIIVAARPSMGKTAFVLSMARNMTVDHGKSVALFSLEMSALQLVNRLIVSETELPAEKIKTGKLTTEEWQQLDTKIKALENARLFIDDTPGITIFELRAKCRRLKREHNIDIVIIDYLQLMNGPAELKNNREQEVSTISRSLKALAKELDVPVIALSQMNRMVENRSGQKRPQLSDLRESGAIEQDADLVLFIHRPEKYGIETFDDDNTPTRGVAEIIIAKHRNGPTKDIRLRFNEQFARFSDLEDIIPMDGPILSSYTIGSKMNEDKDEDIPPPSVPF